MATKSSPKLRKECVCGATVFQGPYQRGEVVDGKLEVREEVVQCRGCHREYVLGADGQDWHDRELPDFAFVESD